MNHRNRKGETDGSLLLWFVGLVLVVMLCTWLFAINVVKPDAGEEAVLIHKTIFFGEDGVDRTPAKTGRHYVWFTTSYTMVNMQPTQHEIHFKGTDALMSSDGVPLEFDSVVRLQVTNSVTLVEKFGPNWYVNNIEKEFMNKVRQAVRKHGMNETAIDTHAIDDIDKEVTEAMTEYLKQGGIPVKLLKVTIGKANPPTPVKDQRIETANQQQRRLTEGQRKLAEDSRKAAEQSRAEADNAYQLAMQLSPEQFLTLENIRMQKVAAEGGKCTFIIGSAIPALPITPPSPPAPGK